MNVYENYVNFQKDISIETTATFGLVFVCFHVHIKIVKLDMTSHNGERPDRVKLTNNKCGL